MFRIKLLGGAKKSFLTDTIFLNESNISISQLLDVLVSIKPANTPKLDINNILIAVNGIDSSAINGKSTVIKTNDTVSVIPVIHGGASKRILLTVLQRKIQVVEISGQNNFDSAFIDELRKNFPKLKMQAICSKFVLNSSHVKKIIALSIYSQKNDILLSNKLETDILMRFALSSQISTAITLAGIKPKKNFILIALGDQKQLDQLYSQILPYTIAPLSKDNGLFLQKQFGITSKRLNSVLSKHPLEDLLVESATILF